MPNPADTGEPDKNAYGKRSRLRSRLRHMVKRGSRLVRKFAFRPLDPNTAFLPYPAARDEQLGDFAARSTWYLGRWSRPDGARDAVVRVPDYLDQSIDITSAERVLQPGDPVHYLIWKVTPWTFFKGFLRPFTYTIVDPSLAKDVDRDGYLEVTSRLGLSESPDTWSSPPPPRDAALVSERSALVLGTGPSARELEGSHADWTYRLVCNSAIRDAQLMERLRPTHICFGDPVFHAGPSAYAGVFRADLERVAKAYDSQLVVPAYCAPSLAANMPWARDRILPLTMVNQEEWNIPSPGNLTARNTGNVLTQQMLPIAIGLAGRIDVGGADGRKPEEKYFWTHSKQHQYSDELMQTVFTAHPAFFRDTDYEDYYEAHCEAMESLISHGESLGCEVRGITTSYIPALASRALRQR